MRSSSSRAFCFFLLLLCSSTLQIGSPRSCLFISCLFLCSSALQIGSPRSCLFLCSLALQISLPRSTHPDRASSDRARFFGAPDRASSDLFFFRSFFLCSSSDLILEVQKSSLRNSVLHFGTQVFKSRDLCGIILATHQVGIESLTLKF